MVAAAVRARREYWEEVARQTKLKEERRVALAREAEELRLLRKRLVILMQRWERAERIRRILDAMRSRMADLPADQVSAAGA